MAQTVRAEDGEPLLTELDDLGMYLGADQLVEVTTRSPKPLNQVAENVTIITAEEIEAMNAHTVGEVLNRVSGIIVDGGNTDFGSRATMLIHGSDYQHVLVLLDSIRWGYVSFDYPETNSIPVQIIKRIEVIKGAASSTWGSSLGGVVNIITKDAGKSTRPAGTLSTTYGESDSSDLRADAAGRFGRLGYYVFGGIQKSDGIRDTRFFDNRSVYGKLQLDLPRDMQAGLSLGHSRPDTKYYYIAEWDEDGVINDRVFFGTAFFSAPLSDSLTLNLSGYRLADTLTDNWRLISTGLPFNKPEYEGKTTGASGRLVWQGKGQTVVLGTDYERRQNSDSDLLAPYTAQTIYEEIWAVFINDTIRLKKLTVIPGLRFDRISIADDQVSPSLGLTFQVNDSTLLRGSVSRGFRKPYAALENGDPYFYITNPDLESENITSLQAGLESIAIPFLKLKATLFRHRVEDAWTTDPDTWQLVNGGDFDRQGMELGVQSGSWHNLSLAANGTIIRMKPEAEPDGKHYIANILLQYDNRTWRGQIFGHNIWLGDVSPPVTWEGRTGTFIWDAVAGRRFHLQHGVTAEVFAALHNIFDDEQYTQWVIPNGGRWFEAGLRLHY